MQDMDIRGAGNLLGAEQSGFIADTGFETYHRILDEAILELKEEEFPDLFHTQQETDEPKKFITECNIETDFEILFPETYINNISERLRLYRELDRIETEEELVLFAGRLADRFGPLPREALDLMDIVRLRWEGVKAGLTRILIREKKMTCYFIPDQESQYYQSSVFSQVLHYVQHHPGQCTMKEINHKLTITFRDINSVYLAIKKVRALYGSPDE
jgi:transcription-repair coupling factor (superfamily II helicase)